MPGKVYLGLVHYPIYNKHNEVIATAITNFDMHDISRTARTYNIAKYFIIHPQDKQIKLAREIMGYWLLGYGGEYNPDRKEAFSLLSLADSIESVIEQIGKLEGRPPVVVTTDARVYPNTVSYSFLREKIKNDSAPVLVLFGTGWGIEKNCMLRFDYILEPIYGACDYNHLSVRSAAAIILDRLLGEKWW